MFSRSAARKTSTHEQLREAMTGIEFRDTDAFLDNRLRELDALLLEIDDGGGRQALTAPAR
jgi:hypothetical protein